MAKSPFHLIIHKIPPPFRNFYVVTTVLFVLYILFFSNRTLPDQWKLQRVEDRVESNISFYKKQIEKLEKDNKTLYTNNRTLEKYAREKYLMKKANEEIFVIEEK